MTKFRLACIIAKQILMIDTLIGTYLFGVGEIGARSSQNDFLKQVADLDYGDSAVHTAADIV